MAALSRALLLLGCAGSAAATTATDTFTATLPTATETFTLPTTAATSTETYTLPTATFTLPTGGETATHTFTLPTSTATYDNKTESPTKAPTSPTGSPSMPPSGSPSGSPSGTSDPTTTPTKAGDTVEPTGTPSKDGDTSAPISPSASPTKNGDTGTPVTPTAGPSKEGDTSAPITPSMSPSKAKTHSPTGSPSKAGDTGAPVVSPPWQSGTGGSFDTNAMETAFQAKIGVPHPMKAYGQCPAGTTPGSAGCSCKDKGGDTEPTEIVLGRADKGTVTKGWGVAFIFGLNFIVSSRQSTDNVAAGDSCPSGGFAYNLRAALCGLFQINDVNTMDYNLFDFGAAAGRHNMALSDNTNMTSELCEAPVGGVCPAKPVHTPPPTTATTPRGHHGDDDFPGWAIALCVVLPVLAIGAAVAVYFFVCNKDKDADDGNDPANEPAADNKPGPDDQV